MPSDKPTPEPLPFPPHEVVHRCPPKGSGVMPCCGRTPFELPEYHRMTVHEPITCTGPSMKWHAPPPQEPSSEKEMGDWRAECNAALRRQKTTAPPPQEPSHDVPLAHRVEHRPASPEVPGLDSQGGTFQAPPQEPSSDALEPCLRQTAYETGAAPGSTALIDCSCPICRHGDALALIDELPRTDWSSGLRVKAARLIDAWARQRIDVRAEKFEAEIMGNLERLEKAKAAAEKALDTEQEYAAEGWRNQARQLERAEKAEARAEKAEQERGLADEALAACQSEGGGWKRRAEKFEAMLADALVREERLRYLVNEALNETKGGSR